MYVVFDSCEVGEDLVEFACEATGVTVGSEEGVLREVGGVGWVGGGVVEFFVVPGFEFGLVISMSSEEGVDGGEGMICMKGEVMGGKGVGGDARAKVLVVRGAKVVTEGIEFRAASLEVGV